MKPTAYCTPLMLAALERLAKGDKPSMSANIEQALRSRGWYNPSTQRITPAGRNYLEGKNK